MFTTAKIKERELISLDGPCPYSCKHCYTYELDACAENRTIDQLVESLAGKSFDVVYVSQKRENFVNPDEGIELCRKLFERYGCHIMAITRNVFNPIQKSCFIDLDKEMTSRGKRLFLGVSLIGLQSAPVSENMSFAPSPEERIKFMRDMYDSGIETLALIRPLFPKEIIPFSEIENIVDFLDGGVSCILSGALMVNDWILDRLSIGHHELDFYENGSSEYLKGALSESVEYVDVRDELRSLKSYCMSKNIQFFEHSMPALNYLIEKPSRHY